MATLDALAPGSDGDSVDLAPCHVAAFAHRLCYPSALERKRGEMLLARLGRAGRVDPVSGVPVPYALAQDPFEFLASVLEDEVFRVDGASFDRETYELLVKNFVTHGMDSSELVSAAQGFSKVLAGALKGQYVIDDDALEPVKTSSFSAPRLSWARLVPRSARALLDWSTRVVIKEYTQIAKLADDDILQSDRDSSSQLLDLANDLLVGALAANALSVDYTDVVTPHFAYQVDWFQAPRIDSVHQAPRKPLDAEFVADLPSHLKAVMLDVNTVAQYVVVERGDFTLSDLFASTQQGKNYAKYGANWNLLSMRSVLAQMLTALESGFDVAGLLMQDFHANNVLVRSTRKEPDSPLTGKAWFYTRGPHGGGDSPPSGREKLRIAPDEHRDLFIEIIDFGRSRAIARTPPELVQEGRAATAIIGNTAWESYGITPDPERLDESWDLRRMGLDLLIDVHPPALFAALSRTTGGSASPRLTKLYDQYLHAVVVMSNALRLVLLIIERAKRMDSTVKYATNVAAVAAQLLVAISAPEVAPYTTLKAMPKDYIIEDTAQAVRFYNAIAPILRGPGVYNYLFYTVIFARSGFFASQGGVNGSNPRLTPRWCLDHLPLFDELFSAAPSHADEIRTGAGLMLGIVHAQDMLADPRRGILKVPSRIVFPDDDEAESDDDTEEYLTPSSTPSGFEPSPTTGTGTECITCGRALHAGTVCDDICGAYASLSY
jgi:hypothetical protein